MDNKKMPNNEQNQEMDDLFRMLDEISGRAVDEDLEDTILQYGGGNAVIRQENGFVPDAVQANLADLLITPEDPLEAEAAEAAQQMAFLLDTDPEEAMTEDLPPPPEERRHPLAVLGGVFSGNFLRRGDTTGTLLRKTAFWLSIVALIAAVSYLVSDLCVQPQQNIQLNNELVELYRPEKDEIIVDNPAVPQGTLLSFEQLYARNPEVSGWLSYHSTGRTDFLNIEYPVMYSGDNLKYVYRDYDGKKNKNGTLFLDGRNAINGYDDHDQSMIIYGHNMASGQMFAGLNNFIGSETNARTAASFTFSTLYRKDVYYVFAVALSEEAEKNTDTYFNYYRTEFTDGDQFLSFVQQVRERSLFDYPTDVRDDDTILILATCTGKTSAKLNDGRVLVFARRARAGEQSIQTSHITKNMDVIMPYSWYTNQNMEPHHYYTDSHLQNTQTDSTTNQGDMTTTDTTVEGDMTTDTDLSDTDTDMDQQGGTTDVNNPNTGRPTNNSGNNNNNNNNNNGGNGGQSGTTHNNGGTSNTTTQNGGSSTDTTTVTPSEDTTTQPAEDTTTQPAEDTTTQPAEDTTTQPAEETTTQPAEETTTTAAPEGGDTTEG